MPGIKIFLVGEDHTNPRAVAVRNELEKYCLSNGTIYADERSRIDGFSKRRVNNIGDPICSVYTTAAELYISILVRNAIEPAGYDEYNVNYLQNIYAIFKNEDYLKPVSAFYEKRYKHKNLFQKIRQYLELIYQNPPKIYPLLLCFLRQVFTRSGFFDVSAIQVSFDHNIFSIVREDPGFEKVIVLQFELELRDQAFAESIKDLAAYTKALAADEIIVIVGESHLEGVTKFLKGKGLHDVVVCRSCDDFTLQFNQYLVARK